MSGREREQERDREREREREREEKIPYDRPEVKELIFFPLHSQPTFQSRNNDNLKKESEKERERERGESLIEDVKSRSWVEKVKEGF